MACDVISHQLWLVFYWPGGIVVGNLLSNVIWGVVHDWPQHRKTRKHVEKTVLQRDA